MLIITAVLLFFIGFLGILLSRKNFIIMIMSVELMLLSINLSLLWICLYLDSIFGFLFIFMVLTIAAAETAIGLSLVVVYYSFYSR